MLLRGKDDTPSGIGQFGAALRRTSDTLDFGVYALRFDSKEPQLSTLGDSPSTYHLVFPRGIDLLGISASAYLGDDTVAGEVSERWHMPLVSRGLPFVPAGSLAAPAGQPSAAAQAEPTLVGYATGETLQALASFERQLRPSRLWNGAVLDAEFAATDLLRVESQPRNRLPGTTRLATSLEVVFTPQYFEVLPNLDLTVPIGVQVGLTGRSSVDPGQVAGTGNLTLSVSATYRTVWNASISFTHFLGPANEQALADRDFIAFTLGRTF